MLVKELLHNINQSGILLANKFYIDIEFPRDITKALPPTITEQLLELRASEVNLAGRNITTFEEPNIYGPIRSVPEGVSYAEDVSISFIDTAHLDCRKLMELWQETTFSESSWDLGYYNDFVGRISIITLDKNLNATYGITCYEAYPKTIAALPLSSAPTTEAVKTTVGFAFRYWRRMPMTKSKQILTAANKALALNRAQARVP